MASVQEHGPSNNIAPNSCCSSVSIRSRESNLTIIEIILEKHICQAGDISSNGPTSVVLTFTSFEIHTRGRCWQTNIPADHQIHSIKPHITVSPGAAVDIGNVSGDLKAKRTATTESATINFKIIGNHNTSCASPKLCTARMNDTSPKIVIVVDHYESLFNSSLSIEKAARSIPQHESPGEGISSGTSQNEGSISQGANLPVSTNLPRASLGFIDIGIEFQNPGAVDHNRTIPIQAGLEPKCSEEAYSEGAIANGRRSCIGHRIVKNKLPCSDFRQIAATRNTTLHNGIIVVS